MPDCVFTIIAPTTAREGDVISFRVNPPLTHPCGTIFSYGGERLEGKAETDLFDVVQMAQGSMAVRIKKDSGSFTISVTMECPGVCGPTTKSHTVVIVTTPTGSSDIGWEIYKTVGLPVTATLWFLYMLLYLISLRRLKEAADLARRVYRNGFPKWLQRLLD